MKTLELNYKGATVPFFKGEKVFQKVTPVAREFNAEIKDYFRGKARQEYYKSVCKANGLIYNNQADLPLYNTTDFARTFPDLVQTIKGKYGGTWLREEVIMDFARWLSPDFAVWCDKKIKELISEGQVGLKEEDYSELKVIRKMVDKMIEQEERFKSQDKKIQKLEERINKSNQEQQIKQDYYSVMAYAYLKNIHINHDKAVEISRKARGKCMARQIAVDNYVSNEYGKVSVFPSHILKEVFKELF